MMAEKLHGLTPFVTWAFSFFTNRVVDIWNSLPAAVVFSHYVSSFKRRLTEFNFYRFLRYT